MKLIDKDALVSEIERRNKEAYGNEWGWAVQCSTYDEIISIINSIEVKEVDLEKLSISEQRIKYLIFEFWTGLQTFDTSWYSFADAYSQGIKDILKELGLKAQKGE